MKLKKILAVMLALVMVLSFAACTKTPGNENGSDVDPSNVDGNNSASEIVIGVSGPLTGGAAQYGNAVVNAAQLAVDEINAAGGVNGTNLKLVSADDEADSGEKAVSAYNSLKDQGMQIFLGTVTSGSCLAVIDKTADDNMFQLTPSASADAVIANDNCFQICFTDSNQGARSAQYIAENNLATKVAVIYDSSDAYSTGIYNNFKKGAADKNLEIVAEQSFTKDSNKDFSAQIQACKTAGADLVFLPIYYTEASLILKAAANADYAPKFFGCDGLDGILSVENFDVKLAEGVMLLTPFAADAEDDATKKFVAAYKAKYNNEIPNQFAADAYDGIYILAELIKANNITADMSASDICDILKVEICKEGFSYKGLTGAGSALTWDNTGAVSKDPMAVVIKDGAYAAL
ncbi:MAG: ABC transporter substrate-binding protein [Clostridia bacterium]|nr:ABC transporter substrate-binding protein [Clostridia bacterium]